MDLVNAEINKTGQKAPKKQMEAIKKKLKHKDKKGANHAKYLASIMYQEGYEFNQHDEEQMFPTYLAKSHDKDKDKNEEKEEVLPTLLVYGVTVTLCGVFLMVLPILACKDWGSKMVVAGVTACANSLSSETDKKKEKDKK